MFDWNDEEVSLHIFSGLENIIWGEPAESDDHIVPYPEASEDHCNKKEWNQETATAKLTEQKLPEAKIDIHGRSLESSSTLDTKGGISASGFGMVSWPDLSLSNAVKTDQASIETGLLVKDAEIYQSTNGGKEQSDFVDYSWDNIGNFDDLDRILSNDDPIFGHVNLDNADELWSSSKDVSNNPAPISLDAPTSGALKNTSEHLQVKAEFDQPFTLSYGNFGDPASHGLQNLHAIPDHVEYAGGRCQPTGKEQQVFQANQDMVGKIPAVRPSLTAENVMAPNNVAAKVSRKRNLLKSRKKSEGRHEGNMLQDYYSSWSPSMSLPGQFENHLVPSGIQSFPLSIVRQQQRQLQAVGSLQYQNSSNPFVAPSLYGNLTNTYPAMPVLSHIHSGEHGHQPLLSGYEVSPGKMNPVKKQMESPVKPLTMTPQEKIEKLRRRQQMQAMLAIQKQQQQFGQQVSSNNKTIAQNCLSENQIYIAGTDLEAEDPSTLSSIDPNSPLKQDDSSTISVAVHDYFIEDAVLYRLQNIISKLDIKIRLCIRDSLFRLAQSAMQRHYASDTSSTNKSSRDELELIAKEESSMHNRYTGLPNVETETNAIDRTVAHLLFHRPLESPGNDPETPGSPISAKIYCKRKAADPVNLWIGCMPEDFESKPDQVSKDSCLLAGVQPVNQLKDSPCIDNSENASSNEPADVGAQEVEDSQ
ncbi:protein LNK2-like isoform X2 [Quillaja saponaria]|uniref:Protein LNK2-like isoform X2 n=1 Tax=Quillaja saponaria TaxID=32244 RepID=A0AAD7PC06_QUISA|nr:protein LNK2-like isoform X2 [Quillaja saponaria]